MLQRLWKFIIEYIPTDAINHRPDVAFWDDIGYAMRRFPDTTRSVLDVGIWSGWFGAVVRSVWGIKVYGVECYKPYIVTAEQFYDRIIEADAALGLPMFADKSVDVVCCFNTIEHFEDPLLVLKEMERVARKAVFISTTNYFTESTAWDGNRAQLHRTLLTSKQVEQLGYTVRGGGLLTKYIGMLGRRLPHLDSAYIAYKYIQGRT